MSVAVESLTLNSSVETNGTSTPQKIVSISADAIKDDQTKTTPNYKNHNRVNTGHRRQPSADYTFVRMIHRGANVKSYGTVLQFVETLCKLNPITTEKVEKFIKLFPKVKGYESFYGSQKFSTQIVSLRGQEVVEASGYFLITSNGQFVDMILPILLDYLCVLPQLKVLEEEIKKSTANFTSILVTQLVDIAIHIKETRNEIMTKLITFYEAAQSFPYLLQGALSGLGKAPAPLNKEQIELIVNSFESKLSDRSEEALKFKVLIMNVMKQLSQLPETSPTYLQSFHKSALHFLEQKKNYQVIEKDTFSCAIQVIVACGLYNTQLMGTVTDFLMQYFTTYFEVQDNLVFSPAAIDEYQTALNGLTQIVSKFPSKASGIVDFIVETLLRSISAYDLQQYAQLRDTAVEALCKILKSHMVKPDNQVDLSLVNSVFTTLYTPFYLAHKKHVKQLGQVQGSRITVDTIGVRVGGSISPSQSKSRATAEEAFSDKKSVDKYKQNENLLSNIIVIIGNITRSLNEPKVTELILLRLLGRIHYPPQNIEVLIIENLVDLCILGQEAAYNTIIVEFMNIFKRILKDTETRNISNTAMPNALLRLANNLSPSLKNIRENLLRRVQKLFCQLGKEITTPENRTYSSPLIQGMGYLLPIIAELSKGQDPAAILESDPESDSAKQTRSVWFYCVLFRFVERQAWRSDWFECTKNIATRSPVLTSKKLYYFKQMQMELEGLLQNGFNDKDKTLHSKALLELLPGNAYNIKNMVPAEILYALSIYYLETLRASSGTYQPSFAYLEDPGVAQSEHLLECCKAIAEKAFPEFLDYVKNYSNKEEREVVLEKETITLMLKYCSRSISARKVADKSIASLAEAFPQITWNKNCLQTLLDLVETIGKSTDKPLMGIVHLPHYDYKVELPDDQRDRQILLKDLVDLSSSYLKYGVATAPEQTHTIIQEYLNNFKQASLGFLHHIGFSLAIEITSTNVFKSTVVPSKRDKTAPPPTPNCVNSLASKFVNTLELKASYAGEIEGILDFINDHDANEQEKKKNLTKVLNALLQRFKKLVDQVKLGESIDIKELNNTIYRSVAFLARQKQEKYEQLIHMIVWSPVLIFTAESLQTAVSAWTWLLSARADLHLEIMTEMSDAWSWTVDQRIGLFSDAERDPSPLSQAKTKPRSEKSNKKYIDVPHKLWINFLSERFIVIKESSTDEVKILTSMLNKSLTDPSGLSIQPNSICTRFRLLLLCLRFIHSGALNDVVEGLLRERLYLAAIAWFCHESTWYDPGDREVLVDDIKVLIDFCKAMLTEDTYEKKKKERSLVTFYDTDYSDPQHQKPLEIFLTYDLQKARKLIILLVGSEIDHIIAWTNPQNRIILQVPEETRFSTTKVANWKEFITTAWDISPRLCIHMSKRFPNSKNLRKFLEKKVREEPTAVLDVPEAVTFLVTEQNVRDNIPELKYLLYWSNATPPVAIRMLHKCYNSHPLVTQYAVRVLRNFPPETIIYYIPQLVQALRYDKTELVFQYLVTASKESEFIAHQLIWNTQTYTESSEKTPLGEAAKKLSNEIISNLSPSVEQRYKEEFEFFEAVTNISGTLLEKASTRDARKVLLREELSKIQINSSNLYLPTNPDVKVHGVDATSGTPLQSAAKVPILVTFYCHSRDEEFEVVEQITETKETVKMETDEDDNDNTLVVKKDVSVVTSRKLAWNRDYKQGCIFKVGDDVRQDMLALQIIELFKRTFKNVGLDVFLFPYKVIATKPGCGVIELVPNSMSRNDLGKKVEGGLVEYFQQTYGPPSSEAYQKARLNFVRSMAAYSVVSYILQIKDRHNGNILVDTDGHIIHIDFGFMFDSSPGGDIGFETSPFKLSSEMVNVMGGRPDAEHFKLFMELGVKAFLAARNYADSIITLVDLMLDTELPCFKQGTIEHLQQRLVADKTDKAAAEFFTKKMVEAFSNFSAFTTNFYDLFQHYTQGIDY